MARRLLISALQCTHSRNFYVVTSQLITCVRAHGCTPRRSCAPPVATRAGASVCIVRFIKNVPFGDLPWEISGCEGL